MLSTNDIKQKLLSHLMDLDLDDCTMDEKATLSHIISTLSTLERPTFEESMASVMAAFNKEKCCCASAYPTEQIAIDE